MLINSFQFLVFFACFFVVYSFLLDRGVKLQNGLILIASYYIYGLIDWRMNILLLSVTLVYYGIGIAIEKYHKQSLVIAGISLAVILLLYFKYFNFFISQFVTAANKLGWHLDDVAQKIILPIGISFYMFKLMSYVIDIYRGEQKCCRDFVAFAAYVSFFPTIMSGPIDRPNKFIPQLLNKRVFNAHLTIEGLAQITWGLFLKMCVADRINQYVTAVYGNLPNHNGLTVFIAILLYSLQIYADFAGYSDMAIGVGKMMGFEVMKNFNYPYFARNVAEFWRKWHISLTTWLTEYIYIPLGGNRKGKYRTILNTLIVFTICGLWHGAGWTFILWGFINGCLFIPNLLKDNPKKYKGISFTFDIKTITSSLFTYLLISFCWLIFREKSLVDVGNILHSLVSPWGKPYTNLWVYFVLVIPVFFVHEFHHGISRLQFLNNIPLEVKIAIYILLCLVLGVYNSDQFIYFQF